MEQKKIYPKSKMSIKHIQGKIYCKLFLNELLGGEIENYLRNVAHLESESAWWSWCVDPQRLNETKGTERLKQTKPFYALLPFYPKLDRYLRIQRDEAKADVVPVVDAKGGQQWLEPKRDFNHPRVNHQVVILHLLVDHFRRFSQMYCDVFANCFDIVQCFSPIGRGSTSHQCW